MFPVITCIFYEAGWVAMVACYFCDFWSACSKPALRHKFRYHHRKVTGRGDIFACF